MKFSAREDVFSSTKLQILTILQYPLTVLPTTQKSALIQTHLETKYSCKQLSFIFSFLFFLSLKNLTNGFKRIKWVLDREQKVGNTLGISLGDCGDPSTYNDARDALKKCLEPKLKSD